MIFGFSSLSPIIISQLVNLIKIKFIAHIFAFFIFISFVVVLHQKLKGTKKVERENEIHTNLLQFLLPPHRLKYHYVV